jgi:hypothetical protein
MCVRKCVCMGVGGCARRHEKVKRENGCECGGGGGGGGFGARKSASVRERKRMCG